MNVKMERGPSPLLPSLFLLGLGMLIYWSNLMSILVTSLSLFQLASEAEKKTFAILILVFLVLLVFALLYIPSSFPFFGKSSYGANRNVSISNHDYDGFEFGLGTLLLVLLFILLYHLI